MLETTLSGVSGGKKRDRSKATYIDNINHEREDFRKRKREQSEIKAIKHLNMGKKKTFAPKNAAIKGVMAEAKKTYIRKMMLQSLR